LLKTLMWFPGMSMTSTSSKWGITN
jgi:hypothetical protein